jgi:hypothetical protein
MKTLKQFQAEENRELKALIMVVPIAALIVLYLAIGVGVMVAQRYFSPCSRYETRVLDRDFEKENALRGHILPVLLWGPRFVEHVLQDDMPIRHFIFASDCQRSGQLPEPQRIFARASGDRTCPPGTNEVRGQRCAIPFRVGEPIVRYRAPGNSQSCPQGWIRVTSERAYLECRLPSVAKAANESCPRGFAAWKASADTPEVQTFVNGWSPYPSDVEVCRLAGS